MFSELLSQICAQSYIAKNDGKEPDEEVIEISKHLKVMCRHTSMIAKLKLSKEQIKQIKGKEAQLSSIHPNVPDRIMDFMSN